MKLSGTKLIICAVLALFGAVLPVAAQNRDAVEQQLRTAGYQATNYRQQAGLPTWDLTAPRGRRFQLSMNGALTTGRQAALTAFQEDVFSLTGLTVSSARVVFERDRGTLILIPSRYIVDGRDVAGFMPSGMQFSWEDALGFDFRMVVDNLALRINGNYITEEQFRNRITRAVEDPITFIESADPQVISRRVEALQAWAEQLERDLAEREAVATREFIQLQQRLEDTRGEGAAALSAAEARAAREREALTATFTELLTLQDERFQMAILDLSRQQDESREDALAFRRGAVVMATRSLFGSIREVEDETIDLAVALRLAEPEIEADELLTRINETLPEETQPLHARHVQAILTLFFNDYR